MLRAPKIRRGPTLMAAIAVCLCMFGLLPGRISADGEDRAVGDQDLLMREALRDSLRQEIRQYSEMIRVLRDSLVGHDPSLADDAWLIDAEDAIESLGHAIGTVTEQLSELQVEIGAEGFSLSDRRGGRVSVDFPQDLGERLSQGIASITRVILDEIPDSLRVDDGVTRYVRSWNDLYPEPTAKKPKPERRIHGDIFKFNDDVEIAADEVIEGDVVVVFADVVVKGAIQGDLVVLLGKIELQQDAVIEGTVVQVFGRLDRHAGAQTGQTTVRVADLGEGLLLLGRERPASAWPSFLVWQGMFMLVLLLVVLLLALLPRARIDDLVSTLKERSGSCLFTGLLVGVFGHVAMIGISTLLILTVIGIPVALLVLLALAIVDLAAIGIASVALGRYLGTRLGLGSLSPWKAAFLGLLILHLPAFLAALGNVAGMAPALVSSMAWIGRAGKLAALALGLGSMLLGRFGAPGRAQHVTHIAPMNTDLNAPSHE